MQAAMAIFLRTGRLRLGGRDPPDFILRRCAGRHFYRSCQTTIIDAPTSTRLVPNPAYAAPRFDGLVDNLQIGLAHCAMGPLEAGLNASIQSGCDNFATVRGANYASECYLT